MAQSCPCFVSVALPHICTCAELFCFPVFGFFHVLTSPRAHSYTFTAVCKHKMDLFLFCFIVLFILFQLLLHFLLFYTHRELFFMSMLSCYILISLFCPLPHYKSVLPQKLPFCMKHFAAGQRSTCFGGTGGH